MQLRARQSPYLLPAVLRSLILSTPYLEVICTSLTEIGPELRVEILLRRSVKYNFHSHDFREIHAYLTQFCKERQYQIS